MPERFTALDVSVRYLNADRDVIADVPSLARMIEKSAEELVSTVVEGMAR